MRVTRKHVGLRVRVRLRGDSVSFYRAAALEGVIEERRGWWFRFRGVGRYLYLYDAREWLITEVLG